MPTSDTPRRDGPIARQRLKIVRNGGNQNFVGGSARERGRNEILQVETGGDDALLCTEHVEVRRETMLVALASEAVRLFEIGQCAARLHEL